MHFVKQSELYDSTYPDQFTSWRIQSSISPLSFAVKLDGCVGNFNTLNDLSNKVCVPNKTEDLNVSVSKMIAWINESKTLTKHASGEYKCKLNGTKCNSNQWWNNDKVDISIKNIIYVKRNMFCILVYVFVKNI